MIVIKKGESDYIIPQNKERKNVTEIMQNYKYSLLAKQRLLKQKIIIEESINTDLELITLS